MLGGYVYKGVELLVYTRRSGVRFVSDLDLRDSSNGIVFRRWWPVVSSAGVHEYGDAATAEAEALRFGREFVDQS